MNRMSGRRSPSRASNSRNPPNARRRSSCWSGTSGTFCGSRSRACACRSTGKTRSQGRLSRAAEALRPGHRQALQVAAQGVHQAVQRLIGYRLVLITAAREDHRIGVGPQVFQEVLHQGRLSRPGPARDGDNDRTSLPHRGEGVVEGCQMRLPSDERRPGAAPPHGPHRLRCSGRAIQPAQDLRPGGPGFGPSSQQIDAQGLEVGRQVGNQALAPELRPSACSSAPRATGPRTEVARSGQRIA